MTSALLILDLIMLLRRVKFYKHLLYNCGMFLCDVFLIIYCRIFVMMSMTHLVMFFGQSVLQLNVCGLYMKLMLTFRCTFIFVRESRAELFQYW